MSHAATSRHWRTVALLSAAAWVALLAVACGGGGDEAESGNAQPRSLGLARPSWQAEPGSVMPTATGAGHSAPAPPCGPLARQEADAPGRAPLDQTHVLKPDPEQALNVQLQSLTAVDLGLNSPAPIAEPFQD